MSDVGFYFRHIAKRDEYNTTAPLMLGEFPVREDVAFFQRNIL